MNCSGCNKILAPTISVCFGCGTMVADSVREELEIHLGPAVKTNPSVNHREINFRPEKKETFSMPAQAIPNASSAPVHTAEINVKTTVPTLVEFQSKNAAVPDWRLKMQNAVRQRIDGQQISTAAAASPTAEVSTPRTRLVTSGANALKPQIIEETAPVYKNDRVANALKRIEESRQMYLITEDDEELPAAQTNGANKNYPFKIAPKTAEPLVQSPENKASVNVLPKPKLVSYTRNANDDLDTNKLPRLAPSTPIAVTLPTLNKEIIAPADENSIHITTQTVDNPIENPTTETAEIDDLAPFALRFNAGLFDLIIGSFASLILLAPFMLAGGEWFSFKGFLGFAVTCSVVMFIYMTLTTGYFGRTLGMRLFSLELIDIEANEYPTFHQAAVNSAVYLLSLMFGGIGFLTIPFNEEKRAVHDLVSGTIVVKEY